MGGSSTITPEARLGGVPIQQSAEGTPVVLLFGRNRLAVNLVWYSDFYSVEKRSSQGGGKGGGIDTVTYDYYAALVSCVCQGPAKLINLWRGKTKYTAAESSEKLGITFVAGYVGQGTWSHLSGHTTTVSAAVYDDDTSALIFPAVTALAHVGQDIGYSATAYLCAADYPLDSGAQIPNHTVEVESLAYGPVPSPVDIMLALMGIAGVPSSSLGSVASAQAYIGSMGIYACPVYTSATPCADMVFELATIANVGLVGSEGLLKFVPYSATAVGSYAPNITPVFGLTDDDYIAAGDDPVQVQRKSEADTYNHVRIEYADATREYNTAVAEAKDDESIARGGLRSKDSVKLNGITSANVARLVAQQILQREIAVRNTYEFVLDARHVRLEPMDYVTLTDSYLGLDKVVVRIIEIEEQDDDTLHIKAEDAPYAAFHPAVYELQKLAGHMGNYNAPADSVAPPVFFERPISAVPGTHLAISVAVTGGGSNWGGADVYMSLDNATYKHIGSTTVRARYGNVVTPLGAADTSVNITLAGMGGQMYSGTPLDADNDATLCWVGQAGQGEYISHQGAALRYTNGYALSDLRRGRFRTAPQAAPRGAQFVRVDSDLFQTEPLPLSMVGQTVWFKFASRNQYSAALQSLVDVPTYAYTVTGQMIKLPPSDVKNFTMSDLQLTWAAIDDADVAGYLIRWNHGVNTWWDTAIPLHEGIVTYSPYAMQAELVGTVTFLLKAVDTTGNMSVNAAVIHQALPGIDVDNIVFEQDEQPAFAGTRTACSAIGGALVADDAAAFYGPAAQPFWGADNSAFYSSNYADMIYKWSVMPTTAGRLLLLYDVQGTRYNIDYQRDNQAAFYTQDSATFYGADSRPFYGIPTDWMPWRGKLDLTSPEQTRFALRISGGTTRGSVAQIDAVVDVPDMREQINNVAITAAGTRLPLANTYRAIKNVQLTVQADGGQAVAAKVADKQNTGPLITTLDASYTPVAGHVDAVVVGY